MQQIRFDDPTKARNVKRENTKSPAKRQKKSDMNERSEMTEINASEMEFADRTIKVIKRLKPVRPKSAKRLDLQSVTEPVVAANTPNSLASSFCVLY